MESKSEKPRGVLLSDREAGSLITFAVQRAERRGEQRARQRIPSGPRALQRMPTHALVAETYRRIGEQGKLTQRDTHHLNAEFKRRGFSTVQGAISGRAPVERPQSATTAATIATLSAHTLAHAAEAKLIADTMAQTIAENHEGESVDQNVVTQPMTEADYEADFRDVGVPADAAKSLAFTAVVQPQNLHEAIEQQVRMEGTHLSLIHI